MFSAYRQSGFAVRKPWSTRAFARIVCLVVIAVLPLLLGNLGAVAATSTNDYPAVISTNLFASESTSAASPATGTDELATTIDALIESEPGVYGVVVMRPDGDVLYARNGDTPFVSASLYKLILLADVARAIDDGTLAPDTPLLVASEYFDKHDWWDAYYDPSFAGTNTTVQEAMFAAGAYSSNVAAMALLSVTSIDELNAAARELGLNDTYLFTDPTKTSEWPPSADNDITASDATDARDVVLSYATDGEVNLTTPMDMAHYFELMMNGEIFNERVSQMIMAILQEQVVVDRFPALLPPETEIVHKTGNLDHVVHDVGVIFAPEGPVILAAMVEAPPDDERAAQIVQRLALIAYGDLDVPPLGPPSEANGGDAAPIDGTSGSTSEAGIDVGSPADSDADPSATPAVSDS